MSNYFAQTEALMNAKKEAKVLKELKCGSMSKDAISTLTSFRIFEGNKPIFSLLIKKLTLESFG